MQDIVKVMTVFSQAASLNSSFTDNGIATQTEIVAVHTPQVRFFFLNKLLTYFCLFKQGEAGKIFPFQKQTRPSSLPLPINQRKKDNAHNNSTSNTELQQYADNLVDDVIKTVSDSKDDCMGEVVTEITVTDTEKIHETEITT